jgi:hypothetical protein
MWCTCEFLWQIGISKIWIPIDNNRILVCNVRYKSCNLLINHLPFVFIINVKFKCIFIYLFIVLKYKMSSTIFSKLTRGSSQVNLALIETETRVQAYFDTPFLNFKIFLKVHIKFLHKPIFWHITSMQRSKSSRVFFLSVCWIQEDFYRLQLYTQNCKICQQPCMFF